MDKFFLKDKIEKNLSKPILDVLFSCSDIAKKSSFSLYLIGGIVRDLILSKPIFDIDIIVEGDAIEFVELLRSVTGCEILKIQNDLRTVKIRFDNGIIIDFASTRCENYPQKGFLPQIQDYACSLRDDVNRRDFTVNAMAISLNSENLFEIVDYLDGKNDIEKKFLRVLHDNSFIDDPSRIIRGLKFAQRFGFKLDEHTRFLQENYLEKPLSEVIPLERIKKELKELFSSNAPSAYDEFINQKIYKIFTHRGNLKITGVDIENSVKKFAIKNDNNWFVYFAILILFENEATFLRFNLSKTEKNIIIKAKELVNSYSSDNPLDDYEIFCRFKSASELSLAIYYAMTQDANAQKYFISLKNIKTEITGDDLISLGIVPSAKMRKILVLLLEQKVKKNISSKSEEILFVKNLIKTKDF